ncbi:hypothetical protein GC088_12615 [Arthrobacter sp. JZ12]|uniref:hypothetical protein n=1 Tax=Arthrobacter sp. JZ12 TaxID=2654190 RepID=UPI002B46A9DC|nr:hypothetical protein [Arthrobacter sp. JZ12]WRH25829.1 hypothetical protein GC088_12615 [Arthrobacter sp. JZ12]
MIKVVKWLITVALLVGLIVLVERLWGSEPAALLGTLIAVSIGVSLGITWGSRRADETDEYRQKWLSRRRDNPEDQDGNPA